MTKKSYKGDTESQMSRNTRTFQFSPRTSPVRLQPSELCPAGMRIPTEFKKTLPDKIQIMKNSLIEEGRSPEQIKQAVETKKIKTIEKYGNRSKVGMILDKSNHKVLDDIVKQNIAKRATKLRKQAEWNRQVFDQK